MVIMANAWTHLVIMVLGGINDGNVTWTESSASSFETIVDLVGSS
jgi:hypothetical protein